MTDPSALASPPPAPAGRLPRAAPALLLAAVALAHGGALGNGFAPLDDGVYVAAVPEVRAGLTRHGLAWAFGLGGRETYFHPLTWLSLMLDAELFGVEPWGFHLVNVLLHGLAACLLLLLLWRTTRRPAPAFAAAVLWAVHPLTVEAVAWVAQRKAVLSTALVLGAALLHASHARAPSRRKIAGVAACVALAALAKPAAVVAPVLLLALDLWPLGRLRLAGAAGGAAAGAPPPWRLVVEKAPAMALGAGVLVAGLASVEVAQGGADAAAPLAHRLAVALSVLPRYLGAAAWPTGLSVFHPYPGSVGWGEVALGAALLAGATAAAIRGARRWPAGLAGWAWFLAALAPYLGLYQVGLWPGWAERFAYLPLAGLASVVAYGGADLAARVAWGPRVAAAALAAAVAALSLATRAQVAVWRDGLSLYAHGVRSEPESAVLRSYLGKALARAGRPEEARAELERALAAAPRLPWANAELAALLRRQGDLDGARRHYLAALEDWRHAPDVLLEFADFLDETGNPARAEAYRRRFLEAAAAGGLPVGEREPRAVELLLARGREPEAEALLRRMLAREPRSAWANAQLGTALMRRGALADAERHLLAALEASPDVPEVLFNLAEVLRASGQPGRARPYYERFARVAPARYAEERRQALEQLGREGP